MVICEKKLTLYLLTFQVLNMQQYSPENITVKLNGNELTVSASLGGGASNTDDFRQVHAVPEGIDLEQLSSSFSADGVLVIKAPRFQCY